MNGYGSEPVPDECLLFGSCAWWVSVIELMYQRLWCSSCARQISMVFITCISFVCWRLLGIVYEISRRWFDGQVFWLTFVCDRSVRRRIIKLVLWVPFMLIVQTSHAFFANNLVHTPCIHCRSFFSKQFLLLPKCISYNLWWRSYNCHMPSSSCNWTWSNTSSEETVQWCCGVRLWAPITEPSSQGSLILFLLLEEIQCSTVSDT